MKRDLLLAYIALAAICIIWGTTYLALRIAVVNFPAFLFTALRQNTAGLMLLAYGFFINKAEWPSVKIIIPQAIAGFFMITLGNGLVAWAEMYIPSGIAAIICSLMPMVVILMNIAINREEKPNIPIVGGVVIGMAGIALVFSEHLSDLSNPQYISGIIATLIAVLGWAGASIWMKKQGSKTNIYYSAGLQMSFGGLWLYPFSLMYDDYSMISLSAGAVYPFIYLVLIGSIVAYLSYQYALRKLPMTIVSLYAYINPLVAVLLGWLILDEKLNSKIGIAFVITVAGIYVVNKGYQMLKEYRAQLSQR